jgi:hypothetical protein
MGTDETFVLCLTSVVPADMIVWGDPTSLFVRFTSRSIERISTKLRIEDLHQKLLVEFNFGPYGCNITSISHEARIDPLSQIKNCSAYKHLLHNIK